MPDRASQYIHLRYVIVEAATISRLMPTLIARRAPFTTLMPQPAVTFQDISRGQSPPICSALAQPLPVLTSMLTRLSFRAYCADARAHDVYIIRFISADD